MIGAMLQWDSPNMPERFFDAFRQCLEGFAETNTGGLGIGVGQHKMIEHMWERLTCNRHSKIFHVREIGLSALCWRVTLFKDHLLLRSMQRSPLGDMASQRAILGRTIPAGMLFAQQGKQR